MASPINKTFSKEHYRKTLHRVEPKVDFSVKTGAYSLTPLTAQEEEEKRTVFVVATKKTHQVPPKVNCGLTRKQQHELRQFGVDVRPNGKVKKWEGTAKGSLTGNSENDEAAAAAAAARAGLSSMSGTFDESASFASSPSPKRKTQAPDPASKESVGPVVVPMSQNQRETLKKLGVTPSPVLAEEEIVYEATSWKKKQVKEEPLKEDFTTHRCTFGLPRWKKSKNGHESLSGTRSKSTDPSIFAGRTSGNNPHFRGRTENSKLPDPLICSTPDPTLMMHAASDHGLPSVRKTMVESTTLRKGVKIEDVQDATFLNSKSPFLPALRKDEDEHDEGFITFHRQRRRAGSEADTERQRGNSPENAPAHIRSQDGLNIVLQKPRIHVTKVNQIAAGIVENAIQRDKEEQKKMNKKRMFDFGDAAAGGGNSLPSLATDTNEEIGEVNRGLRKRTMSFADAAALNLPLLHNAGANVVYAREEAEKPKEALHEVKEPPRPRSPFRFSSKSSRAGPGPANPSPYDNLSSSNNRATKNGIAGNNNNSTAFSTGGGNTTRRTNASTIMSCETGISHSDHIHHGHHHEAGKKCHKKCVQCCLVEGIIDEFEDGLKHLRDRRRQEEMIARLKLSGNY